MFICSRSKESRRGAGMSRLMTAPRALAPGGVTMKTPFLDRTASLPHEVILAARRVRRWVIQQGGSYGYGCAVSTLAACREHGEALRRWHNLRMQIDTEGARANESGGVLHPALLSDRSVE